MTQAALQKAYEEELEYYDLDLDSDPTEPSLEDTAKAGHPFSVSWSREVRPILAGLDSDRLRDPKGPWVLETPFDTKSAQLSTIIADSIRDATAGLSTTGSYHDGLSTTSESSKEHLSAALGLTVGYPFLNASVSAKYDRRVAEDKNGIKASRNSCCRAGRVILDRTPAFSAAALALLKSGCNAKKRFRERYGDFYICGFVLGADAGACLSASTESKSSKETLEITVKVKFLFFTASTTHTETSESQSQSSSICLSGYSSLDTGEPCALNLSSDTASLSSNQMALQQKAKEYLDKVKRLPQLVEERIKTVGLTDGGKLPLADCSRLCRSGLVVELLLAPFARLNEYVESIGI